MRSKHHMTGRPGPLVQSEGTCTILTLTRMAQPPVGLYYFLVCSLAFSSTSFYVILSQNTLSDPLRYHSVPFASILFYSIRFGISLVTCEASLYINRCTIPEEP